MTRSLTRLADLAYRRRGRMVIAWVVATIVIIAVGSSLAGEYHADYNTPGSESKAASELTEERFAGYSGQEVYVVWKSPDGADSPAVQERIDAFLAAAQRVEHVSAPTPTRVSENGTIGATTLPLTIDGWEVPREDGEKLIAAAQPARVSRDGTIALTRLELDRRALDVPGRTGTRLIELAEAASGEGLEIELAGPPIRNAQEGGSPLVGLIAAAIILLVAFGSVVAVGLPAVPPA